jgi:hypothetical protein
LIEGVNLGVDMADPYAQDDIVVMNCIFQRKKFSLNEISGCSFRLYAIFEHR